MLCFFFIVVCLFCILYFICIFLLLLPTWRIKFSLVYSLVKFFSFFSFFVVVPMCTNLDCSHALFAFNETVRYFMNNNSRAFGAFLDISKAFDKVLHNGLFKKLLDRNVPVCLVLLLKYWYGHLQCAVRWNNALGNWFSILSGVRQGGVGLLSPVLFSV